MNRHRPRRVRRALTRLVLLLVAVGGLGLFSASFATADPPAATWRELRGCESSGDYQAVNRTGKYRGAYQFDLPTWRSVGGSGLPDAAAPTEQDYRALYLYRMRGWQPWECGTILGLRNDQDGASRRVPGYGDSAYIGGGANPAPPPPPPAPPAPPTPPTPPTQGQHGAPAWPGKVYVQGDCAPALRTFQLRMNEIGSPYRFHGTGCYQQQTRLAVLALQRANGIRDSGKLGPKTWAAAWRVSRL